MLQREDSNLEEAIKHHVVLLLCHSHKHLNIFLVIDKNV